MDNGITCQHAHLVIKLANESNATEELIRQRSSNPDDGGVYLAGPLIAQEMVNVLTRIGVITNLHHATNVILSRGSKTFERLKKMRV